MVKQLELSLDIAQAPARPRPPRKGCQAIKGVRFAPWHPVLEFDGKPVLARTWKGLGRSIAYMKTRLKLAHYTPALVVVRATEDDGDTWRTATPRELSQFMENVRK